MPHSAGHGTVSRATLDFTWWAPKLPGCGWETDDAAGGTHGRLPVAGGWRAVRPAEGADDVWSLCMLLFEMVSGDAPVFAGDPGTRSAGSRNRIRRRHLTAAVWDGEASEIMRVRAKLLGDQPARVDHHGHPAPPSKKAVAAERSVPVHE